MFGSPNWTSWKSRICLSHRAIRKPNKSRRRKRDAVRTKFITSPPSMINNKNRTQTARQLALIDCNTKLIIILCLFRPTGKHYNTVFVLTPIGQISANKMSRWLSICSKTIKYSWSWCNNDRNCYITDYSTSLLSPQHLRWCEHENAIRVMVCFRFWWYRVFQTARALPQGSKKYFDHFYALVLFDFFFVPAWQGWDVEIDTPYTHW